MSRIFLLNSYSVSYPALILNYKNAFINICLFASETMYSNICFDNPNLGKCDCMLFYSVDNFCKEIIPPDPIIFSQVPVESFDYGHGMKPMTSTTIPAKKESDSKAPVKGRLCMTY